MLIFFPLLRKYVFRIFEIGRKIELKRSFFVPPLFGTVRGKTVKPIRDAPLILAIKNGKEVLPAGSLALLETWLFLKNFPHRYDVY